MKFALLQTYIRFKENQVNIQNVEQVLLSLPDDVEVAILPEMFSTGFCPQNRELAESVSGETLTILRGIADKKNIAIVGSFMCREGESLYNRGFFIMPGALPVYVDKGHLYAHGGEDACFQPGRRRTVITYKDVRFRLVICYDLRFPIWCRNEKENLYDILIVVANWPQVRIPYWDILLRARAIENQAYVLAVNNVGTDLQGLHYCGHSTALDSYLNDVAGFEEDEVGYHIVDLDMGALHTFRNKLPLWRDIDAFQLVP